MTLNYTVEPDTPVIIQAVSDNGTNTVYLQAVKAGEVNNNSDYINLAGIKNADFSDLRKICVNKFNLNTESQSLAVSENLTFIQAEHGAIVVEKLYNFGDVEMFMFDNKYLDRFTNYYHYSFIIFFVNSGLYRSFHNGDRSDFSVSLGTSDSPELYLFREISTNYYAYTSLKVKIIKEEKGFFRFKFIYQTLNDRLNDIYNFNVNFKIFRLLLN